MIRNPQGEPVEVIGGPYRRFTPTLGLGFYIETYRCRPLGTTGYGIEYPLDRLKADGGHDEVRRAAEKLLEDD